MEEVHGQIPVNGKCKCDKCGKIINEDNFYTYRDKSKCKLCKLCLTLHIDNFEPDTFLWILEDFDVPYVESVWNSLRDRAFAKNPKKMNGMSVIGKYFTTIKLNQYKNYRWADTDMLNEQARIRNEVLQKEKEKADKDLELDLQHKLSTGEITEAEYKTLAPTKIQYNQVEATSSASLDEENENPFVEMSFIKEEDLPDPSKELTQEDKVYLAMKWGRLYKPNEWIALEQDYLKMKNSFDIQDADTENTLILICKTNLKMNQAIDMGDLDGYQKLSRVSDQLRKSAKFTAAQNKDEKVEQIDSVGELVHFCETHKGKIPKYQIDVPYDIVDKIIIDLKKYTKDLIYQDVALARQIEDYIKRREILEVQKADEAEKKKTNYEKPILTDEDIIAHKRELERLRQEDEKIYKSGEAKK